MIRSLEVPPPVPVPDWHRAILADRLADLEADPDGGRSWEEVDADLTARRRPA